MADHSGFLALPRGASFYKADLHMHSFGSSPDVTDEGMTPAAIVETARARGLGLIALTDHKAIPVRFRSRGMSSGGAATGADASR